MSGAENAPVFGEPFYLAVSDTRLDSAIEGESLEGAFSTEASAINHACGPVEEYGCVFTIYACTPVARIEPLPKSKVIRLDGAEQAP